MKTWGYIVSICIVLILAVGPFILFPGGEFGGADGLAQETITKINPDYEQWTAPLWEPPSGEIESLLFTLQAVIGSLIIGYYIGRISASRKSGST